MCLVDKYSTGSHFVLSAQNRHIDMPLQTSTAIYMHVLEEKHCLYHSSKKLTKISLQQATDSSNATIVKRPIYQGH